MDIDFSSKAFDPKGIEKRSFEIITELLGEKQIPKEYEFIIKRVIHTSADFEYADTLCFSENAVEKAMEALKNGVHIVTDTEMVRAGINKTVLDKLGVQVHCFIANEEVRAEAEKRGTTRSVISMEYVAETINAPVIFAIGNAPTALMRIYKLIEEEKMKPELVIGVPVGFVNVVESKEFIMQANVPYIVAKGRKGGSNVAACIVNALSYEVCKTLQLS